MRRWSAALSIECGWVGDGLKKKTQGCCKEPWQASDEFKAVFYVFEIGEVDAILGIAWLAPLGETTANWAPFMEFKHQGEM